MQATAILSAVEWSGVEWLTAALRAKDVTENGRIQQAGREGRWRHLVTRAAGRQQVGAPIASLVTIAPAASGLYGGVGGQRGLAYMVFLSPVTRATGRKRGSACSSDSHARRRGISGPSRLPPRAAPRGEPGSSTRARRVCGPQRVRRISSPLTNQVCPALCGQWTELNRQHHLVALPCTGYGLPPKYWRV